MLSILFEINIRCRCNQLQMQVQYRVFEEYQRNGYGQLLLDNSQYIIAKWKADKINGYYALLGDQIRGFGTMTANKLEGYNVISMRKSLLSNKNELERTIYGMFRDNKIYGKAIIIEKQEIILGHYVSGQLREISDRKPLREKDVYEMLQAYFPNQPYNIEQSFALIFKQARKDFPLQNFPKYQPKIELFQNGLSSFGFIEVNDSQKWIGLTLFKGQVVTIGEHEEQVLQGIGRIFKNGVVEDGVFKQGNLNGIGIRYSQNGHKYVLGEHGDRNQAFEKGFGFPHKQIYQIRKQFHLRSINFYNDIVLLSMATIFQAIIQNSVEVVYEESPRFTIPKVADQNRESQKSKGRGISAKSPLRAKIDQYQQESDHIEEPSPMKHKKINQYERVNYGRQKYFESEMEEEKNRGFDADRSTEKQRSKQNYRKDETEDRGSHYSKRKVKDTKQLVKQLDEKERTRRDFLQKIYVEAGLTSTKTKGGR